MMVATTPATKPYVPWYLRWELPAVLPGVIFAAVMLWSVTSSIGSSNWAEGLDVLTSVALPALVVGIIFAPRLFRIARAATQEVMAET